MNKNILLIPILFVLAMSTTAFTFMLPTRSCAWPKVRRNLILNYNGFDQSPAGWHRLEGQGRDAEMAQVIRDYRYCRSDLRRFQRATLAFRAAEIYANLGDEQQALKMIFLAFDPILERESHWDYYMAGFMGFVTHDVDLVRDMRDRLVKKDPTNPYVQNLNNMILCFDRPYKDLATCGVVARLKKGNNHS